MRKIIILALTAITMIGCGNPTPANKENKKDNKTPNKYEVLLSTKDTVYMEAAIYYMYHGYFGTNTEPECIFEDKDGNRIQVIHNPVYVKVIRTK